MTTQGTFTWTASQWTKAIKSKLSGSSLMKISHMEISKKLSSGIGALKRVRPFVSMHTAIKMYKGLIEPHFDYCGAVWDGLTQQRSEKLQKLQNSATRVVTKSSYDTSSRYLRLVGTIYRLEWLNKKLTECTSTLIISPQLICVICLPPNYYFRNAKKKLMLPKQRTDYLKRSFSYHNTLYLRRVARNSYRN